MGVVVQNQEYQPSKLLLEPGLQEDTIGQLYFGQVFSVSQIPKGWPRTESPFVHKLLEKKPLYLSRVLNTEKFGHMLS